MLDFDDDEEALSVKKSNVPLPSQEQDEQKHEEPEQGADAVSEKQEFLSFDDNKADSSAENTKEKGGLQYVCYQHQQCHPFIKNDITRRT